jgi:mono/diheme cytochrome c family protein
VRRLALIAALALCACRAGDEPTRYLHDARFRRAHLEASLENPGNRYSRLRLARYATGASGDWDALPAWSPPVTPVDVGGRPRGDERPLPLDSDLRALGEAAFFRYPAQLAPLAAAMIASPSAMARFGLWSDAARGAGGLVSVRFADGSRGLALSCATCHARVVDGALVPGLANQALDLGAAANASWGRGRVDVALPQGEEPVAIPDLRPVAWLTHLHRDGTVRNDLVALAIRIETLIVTAHGQTIRPPREIALGLAMYLWSLAPPARAPVDGTAAARGAATFAARCSRCHAPPGLAGPPVDLDIVQTDPRVGRSPDRGTGGYRVPSLRGVATRGALLHDGSLPGVRALLDPARTDAGHRFGLELDETARAELIAFLETL